MHVRDVPGTLFKRNRANAFAPFRCLLVAALLASCACTATEEQPAPPPPPATATATAPTIAQMLVEESDLAIVVTKHARRLELYSRGLMVQSFPIVLGANPNGTKRYEGDMRTPEGLYRVAAKRSHERWRYFIALNYPTESDRSAYEADVVAGTIPRIGGRLPGLGGNLGIHGNDHPRDQAAGKDWTKGCVAMNNEDIAVLYRVVEVGTPVVVLP
jgi:murein L,D-transpeptidase YafK